MLFGSGLERRRVIAALAIVAAVALAAHAAALPGGFIWLDHAHIEDGLAVAPPAHWPGLFAAGFAGTGFYRPLMALSLSVDAALGGAPWLFHAVSLAWHGAAAVLTTLAALELGLALEAAVLAGALFGAHPVTALVADAIAFRSEAMMTVALLALIVFHRRRQAAAAGLALLLGALTKETAFVLGPLFVVAVEVFPDASVAAVVAPAPLPPAQAGRIRTRVLAAEAVAFAIALLLRLAFAPAWRAGFFPLSPSDAVGTRLATVTAAGRALLLPARICDAFAITPLFSLSAGFGAVLLLGLLVAAWRRRGPALLLLLGFLPALNLVPLTRWWSPHYLYLPLAFAAMALADLRWLRAWPGRLGAGALVLTAVVLSARMAPRFASDLALWQPEVAAQPACREGHFYLGEIAREAGQLDRAEAHYMAAVQTSRGWLSYVDRGAAVQNLGVILMELGRFDEAAVKLKSALDVVGADDHRRKLLHNLATAELRAGHPAQTVELLAPEIARADALPESIFVCARALHDLGREDEARALLRRLPGAPAP